MGMFDRLGYTFNDPANSAVQPNSPGVNSNYSSASAAMTTQNTAPFLDSWKQNSSNAAALVYPTTSLGKQVHTSMLGVHTQAVQMALTPVPVTSLMPAWQQTDLAANNVGGYFQNPVANVVQNIWTLANTYIIYKSEGVANSDPTINTLIQTTISNAVNVANVYANTYLYVTNRESNVTPIGNDFTTVHYTTAIPNGKLASYIIGLSDGSCQNNAVMLGHFTSILIGNTLNDLYTTMMNLSSQFANSINTMTYTSNISLSTAQALQNNIYQVANTLYSFPINDNNFSTNTKQLVNDFSSLRQFTGLGQTETQLLNNYIGTPKLVSRLNSQ